MPLGEDLVLGNAIGRARVVLREPVRPTMVQFRSVVWVEEVPGTVLTDMTVAAFDLDFSSPLNRFPHAVAYADRDCTVHARHTNIHQGAICLGNINDPMTPAEVAARGGSSLARVADLVQMLRLCNLDSPHNGSREFNLRTPESVSEDNWRACATNGVWIPGLRRLDSDSRAHAADPPAPHRGRVELIPDGD